MPIRYTNKSFDTNVIIDTKTEKDITNNKGYFIVKLTFSEFLENLEFGRALFKINFKNIINNNIIKVYKLNSNNINEINKDNINLHYSSFMAVLNIDKDTKEQDIDVSGIIYQEKETNLFSTSFVIVYQLTQIEEVYIKDVTKEEVLVGELFSFKETDITKEVIEQRLSNGEVCNINLFNNDLTINLINIKTSGKKPVSLNITYDNNTLKPDYEYKINRGTDYIELINSIGEVTFYNLFTKEEIKEKYNINVDKEEVYFNISNRTYIINENNRYTLVNKDTKIYFYTINNNNNTEIPLYVNKIKTDYYTIDYSHDLKQRTYQIKSSEEDIINIIYDNFNISKIEYDKNRYIKLTYNENNKVIKVEYCKKKYPLFLEEIIQDVTMYEYNDNALTLVYDDKTKIGYNYTYQNNKITKVEKININTLEINDVVNINSSPYQCILSSYTNERQYYYFDTYGRLYMVLDEGLNTLSIEYLETEIGSISNLRQEIKEHKEENNLIKNNKFDNGVTDWIILDEATIEKIETEPFTKYFTNEIVLDYNIEKVKEIKQKVTVKGVAGEEIEFSFFIDSTLLKTDVCYAYLEVEYNYLGKKTYAFSLMSEASSYRKVIRNIIMEASYKSILVGVIYRGEDKIRLSDFALYKKRGKYYSYNKNNQLTEIGKGTNRLNIEYDDKEKIKRIKDLNGEIYEYTYNDSKDLIKVKDSSLNTIEYEYDNDHYIKKRTLLLDNNKTSYLEQEYTNKGNITKQNNSNGNLVLYEYDDEERVKIKDEAFLETSHYTYDENDRIIKTEVDVKDRIISQKYLYNNDKTLKKVKMNNEELNYSFSYDSFKNIKEVKLNNKILASYTYYKYNNNNCNYCINTNLLETKKYTDGTYKFIYNENLLLTKVKYNERDEVTYSYDNLKRLASRTDKEGITNYTYDTNNYLIKEEIEGKRK